MGGRGEPKKIGWKKKVVSARKPIIGGMRMVAPYNCGRKVTTGDE